MEKGEHTLSIESDSVIKLDKFRIFREILTKDSYDITIIESEYFDFDEENRKPLESTIINVTINEKNRGIINKIFEFFERNYLN